MVVARTRERQKAGDKRASRAEASPPPIVAPLEFAVAVMCDDSQPMAIRAGMARAAMPYLYDRGARTEPEKPENPWDRFSDIEWARRVVHLLGHAHDARRELELIAAGRDVNEKGLPVDKTDWKRIMELLMTLRKDRIQTEYLDRLGIKV